MTSPSVARSTTRRVGRAKATVVALALGGSLALTGAIAAQAADQDVVNGVGTTSTGTATSSTTGTSGSSSTADADSGVSPPSGGSSHATTQGS